MSDGPFASIESAHEYVSLLGQQVREIERDVLEEVAEAARSGPGRRLDALRLVDYKLNQLTDHLATSGRILNDLRALRRLLLGERQRASGLSTADAQTHQDELLGV